jgi:hypothetical protein
MAAGDRNARMVARVESAPAEDPVRFVVAGDSGAWPDPTADAIYAALVRQAGALDPPPLFFANLGDFAGPGTPERHEHHLALLGDVAVPSLCVVGNHDLDDPGGWDAFEAVHGPVNFTFAHGHVRFVVLHSQPSEVGEVDVDADQPGGLSGPREEDLAFLGAALRDADEPRRVVLMHMPPDLGGHFAPHAEWGFRQREPEFLDLLREHRVQLVCCAHGLAFDTCVHEGARFVMSGGGGTGLCSHLRGICTPGEGRPEDRGALFHAVELTVPAEGAITGRVMQAFAPEPGRISF